MLSLLFLVNHFHWSIIFLSLSSLKIVSTYAATPLGTRSNRIENDSQCFLLDQSSISHICSQTCHVSASLMKTNDDDDDPFRTYSLSFCSMFPINRTFLSNETNETGCQDFLKQLITADDEARRASNRFTTYMQAIDSGSKENPYASINSDCQVSFLFLLSSVKRTKFRFDLFSKPMEYGPVQWKFPSIIFLNVFCLVKRSVMKLNVFVPHCDPVIVNHYLLDNRCFSVVVSKENKYLFIVHCFCWILGGIVANSDYDQRPYCFDRCHLSNGSLKRHSVSSSPGTFSTSYESLAERMVTTPQCFNIELHALTEFNQSNSSAILDSQHNRTSSSASSISLRSTSMLVVCFLLIILFGIRLDSCS